MVSKDGHPVRDMKGFITIVFLEKNATVESASYNQLLRQNAPYLLNDLVFVFFQHSFGENFRNIHLIVCRIIE